jgi:hypothetical protein
LNLSSRFGRHVDTDKGPLPDTKAVACYPEIAGVRCWPWRADIGDDGYGRFRFDGTPTGTRMAAHRVAYWLAYNVWPVPLGLHKCGNRSCCNPEHVYAGTVTDNNLDTVAMQRRNSPVGEAHPNRKLTAANVATIRAAYDAGGISQYALGVMYRVNQNTIWKVVNHQTWK